MVSTGGAVAARSFLVISLFKTSKEDKFTYDLKNVKRINEKFDLIAPNYYVTKGLSSDISLARVSFSKSCLEIATRRYAKLSMTSPLYAQGAGARQAQEVVKRLTNHS